jgi:transposase
MAKKRPSWEELKTEYVTTDISYRKIADKYKLSASTVAKMAYKYKWTEARAKHREKIVTKTADKIAENKANKLATIAESADKMADTIHRVMEDTDQFFRRTNLAGEDIVSQKADTKAMKELASAMKDLTSVIRNVYNIPTESESLALQLARERLEVEKRNSEREEDGITTGIVLIPQVMDDDEE